MRVDALNKINELYKTNSVKQTEKSKSSSYQSDQLEISQTAKDYQIAKQAIAGTTDIREDKINDIKARIAAGTYNVSDEDVANKLIEQAEIQF